MASGTAETLTICQGETFRQDFALEEDEVPFDFTGFTGRCQFRRDVADVDPVILFTVTVNILTPLTGGNFELFISAVDTPGLTGEGVYDIEFESDGTQSEWPAGEVKKTPVGKFTVVQEVTR